MATIHIRHREPVVVTSADSFVLTHRVKQTIIGLHVIGELSCSQCREFAANLCKTKN
jgi:hypothetical protein